MGYGQTRGLLSMQIQKKLQLKRLRRFRIRKKVTGTKDRPRMCVHFTNENIYVQFIDDLARLTIASTSTVAKGLTDKAKLSANVQSAKRVGTLAAQAALGQGIKKVVFDRNGTRYHGKVKALADAAREAGLQF